MPCGCRPRGPSCMPLAAARGAARATWPTPAWLSCLPLALCHLAAGLSGLLYLPLPAARGAARMLRGRRLYGSHVYRRLSSTWLPPAWPVMYATSCRSWSGACYAATACVAVVSAIGFVPLGCRLRGPLCLPLPAARGAARMLRGHRSCGFRVYRRLSATWLPPARPVISAASCRSWSGTCYAATACVAVVSAIGCMPLGCRLSGLLYLPLAAARGAARGYCLRGHCIYH